jgi:hypothetical protein
MIDGESQSEPTREELIALNRAQAAEIAALKARVAELERQLGLDSTNSSFRLQGCDCLSTTAQRWVSLSLFLSMPSAGLCCGWSK